MGSDSLSSPGAGLGAVPAAGLVVGGVFALEGAAALATSLIPLAGTPGTVALRLGFGATGLVVIARPDFRRLSSGRAVILAVPAAGALLGLIFLDQRITAWQWAGTPPSPQLLWAPPAATATLDHGFPNGCTAPARCKPTQTPSRRRPATARAYGTATGHFGAPAFVSLRDRLLVGPSVVEGVVAQQLNGLG
jgi:hypothetical protein